MTAVIYSGAQPFFLLERTIVEYQQSFTSVRLTTAPVHVGKLGLDAAWFPAQRWVMTTDGVRMITVTINWHRVSQARRRALGIALARTYLGPFHHNPSAGY